MGGASAIRIEGLWKEYALGAAPDRHRTFYDFVAGSLRAPLRRLQRLRGGEGEGGERFWALRELDLEVARGDVVGVIGRNGAGKSTLLKILNRVTAPTRGRITLHGTMASLLEVGTGFHPELTGRENVFLNGALLGMSRKDIARRFDEIVAFAEVERFIDTPVKRYSSGMYVRLAFSVAAHLERDILVIDEVLAVGDSRFQQKCFGKLEHSRGEGRTILLVSHHMPTVTRLCRSAIWLDHGRLLQSGAASEVAEQYLAQRRIGISSWTPEDADNGNFRYDSVAVVAPAGCTPDSIAASQPLAVEFRFRVRQPLDGRLALQVRNGEDAAILSSASTDADTVLHRRWEPGEYMQRCEIPGHLLAPGTYFLSVSMPRAEGDDIFENILSFRISATDSLVSRDGRAGIVAPMLAWQQERLA